LLVGDVQDALELSPGESISCSHGIVASIAPPNFSFSTACISTEMFSAATL